MPRTTVNATRYAYVDEGEGDLLLFGHGLLASKKMFRANEALKDAAAASRSTGRDTASRCRAVSSCTARRYLGIT